ncbi:arylesterase [Leptospira yasudae]|uniref:Arylesterase n=1 Tax=Leptospira yasudae TaxID=2202201 RepID=A0A6N4QDX2_9LEPT|nr:arylesterase [Leptospira yasudae]TGL74473.1 arylesterase [Leptospira yasudae]TGL80601.1 arylesterase [Leptospira yasudae]TGL84289.1 arylesterase [Leptospira yasudae]
MKRPNLLKRTETCGNSSCISLGTILLLFLASAISLTNCGADIKAVGPTAAACTRIEGLPGPEDLALDKEERILYISSHERRISDQTGKIYWIDLKNSSVPKELPVKFPPEFRPHGMSLLKTKDVYRLYVISHPTLYKIHTVEIFERKGKDWSHVGTLSDPLITSPNDLSVASENEIYLSNDHGSGGFLRYLWDDLFGLKRGEIAYYDGKTWSNLGNPLSYGNGILYAPDSKGNEFLYRSGYMDQSVFQFPIRREQGKPVLGEARQIRINSGSDNLELDSKGRIFVVGHGSTYKFLRHAKNPDYLAPTQVFRISSDGSFEEVFATDGSLISAGSTAIPFEGRLYIAQVFNPFILNCEYSN